MPQPGSFEESLTFEGQAAQDGIHFATVYLSSAVDALLTFYSLAHGAEPAPPHMGGNGASGLLRQALENTAHANWLLSAVDVAELSQRGTAARWDDEKERERFRCAGEDIKFEFNQPRPEGVVSATQACRSLLVDPSVLTTFHPDAPRGYRNAAPLYAWASGAAHGKEWATLSEEPKVVHSIESETKRVQVLEQRPDYKHILVTVGTVLSALRLLTSRLRALRESVANDAFQSP